MKASYRYSQFKIQNVHKSSLSDKPANFHFLFYKLSKHQYSNALLCIVSLYLNPRTLLAVWAGNKRWTSKRISFLQASKSDECSCHLFTFNVCNEFHFCISKPNCILACEIAAQQKNFPQINLMNWPFDAMQKEDTIQCGVVFCL